MSLPFIFLVAFFHDTFSFWYLCLLLNVSTCGNVSWVVIYWSLYVCHLKNWIDIALSRIYANRQDRILVHFFGRNLWHLLKLVFPEAAIHFKRRDSIQQRDFASQGRAQLQRDWQFPGKWNHLFFKCFFCCLFCLFWNQPLWSLWESQAFKTLVIQRLPH